jgi:hypothetical protein
MCRSDPATELQGSYTATQQDQAIGTVLVRVVIRAKSRAIVLVEFAQERKRMCEQIRTRTRHWTMLRY